MEKDDKQITVEKEKPKKQPPKKNTNTERFKAQYFQYYDDVKAFNNGTKEDW